MAVDQMEGLTVFHLFDRLTLRHLGAFKGNACAHTDGIALADIPFDLFPGGAVFAVHDDRGVAAFSWADIEENVPDKPRAK